MAILKKLLLIMLQAKKKRKRKHAAKFEQPHSKHKQIPLPLRIIKTPWL